MNEFNPKSKFDCLKLDAQLVTEPSHDDVIFLHSLYTHLEHQCELETDRLEDLAERITWQTERALAQSAERREAPETKVISDPISEPLAAILAMSERASRRLLDIGRRAEIADRYQVPVHIFGNLKTMKGGTDLELLELEMIQLQIENYMAQMAALVGEIAAAVPTTVEGVMLRLKFLCQLSSEGSGLATDVLACAVEQSVKILCEMMNVKIDAKRTWRQAFQGNSNAEC